MARVVLADRVMTDLDRIAQHLIDHEVRDASLRIENIISALDLLATSPLIGRPTERIFREQVIGRGSHGYVALYDYIEEIDTVFVLSIRSQKEAGYPEVDV